LIEKHSAISTQHSDRLSCAESLSSERKFSPLPNTNHRPLFSLSAKKENAYAPNIGRACARRAPAPRGLEEICATFGDIFGYIPTDHTLDPRWQTEFLARVMLPFSVTLSWDHSQTVSAITCHRLLANAFTGVFDRIQQRTAKQSHNLRRMLRVSSATHWYQAFYSRLGNRDRLKSGDECEGDRRRHGYAGHRSASRRRI
jgi:hypothetical protein